VDVTGIEPVTPCLQSIPGKMLTALSGVAYTGNQTKISLCKCPEVVPSQPGFGAGADNAHEGDAWDKNGTEKHTGKSEAPAILDARNPAAEGEFHLRGSTLPTSLSVSCAFSRSREDKCQLTSGKEVLFRPPAHGLFLAGVRT